MDSVEDFNLNKIYIEQLLSELEDRELDTIVLLTLGYKAKEIARIISDKYEKKLLKPHTMMLRIGKILNKLRQISSN